MIQYVNADLHRIFRRIPRYIALAAVYAIIFFTIIQVTKNSTVYQFMTSFVKYADFFFVALGLFEFIYVYGDDFKAKTMQIAIGTGVSRRKVILAKWVDFAVLMLVDAAVTVLMIVIAAAFNGVTFTPDVAGKFTIIILFGVIKTVGSVGFTMIFLFLTQNTTVGLLIYIVESIGIVSSLLSMLLESGFLSKLHISGYTFSGLLRLASARLMLGSFNFWYCLGIIIYLAAFYYLACLLFKKRELEF